MSGRKVVGIALATLVLLSAFAPGVVAVNPDSGLTESDRSLSDSDDFDTAPRNTTWTMHGQATYEDTPGSGTPRIIVSQNSGGSGAVTYDAGVPGTSSFAVEQTFVLADESASDTTPAIRFFADETGDAVLEDGYVVRFKADTDSVALVDATGGIEAELANETASMSATASSLNTSVEYHEGDVRVFVEGSEVLTHTIDNPDTRHTGLAYYSTGDSVHVDNFRLWGAESNSAPFGAISSPASGGTFAVNESTNFIASADDTDGFVASYEWDFNGDGVTDAIGATVTQSYATTGIQTVTLTVTDDDGATVADSIVVAIEDGSTSYYTETVNRTDDNIVDAVYVDVSNATNETVRVEVSSPNSTGVFVNETQTISNSTGTVEVAIPDDYNNESGYTVTLDDTNITVDAVGLLYDADGGTGGVGGGDSSRTLPGDPVVIILVGGVAAAILLGVRGSR